MNMNTISICTEKDIPIIIAVALQSYNEHYLHLWYDNGEWYKQRCFTPEILREEMSDSNAIFYLLYDNDSPVGFLKLNLHKKLDPYTDADCLELERIYIIKAGTGKGIGKQAIQFTLDLARQLKKKFIWLKAMDTSDAIFFYEKIGFKEINTTRLDYDLMKEEFRGMVVYVYQVG